MSVNTNDLLRHTPATPVVRAPADLPAEPVRLRKTAVHPSLRALPDYPVR